MEELAIRPPPDSTLGFRSHSGVDCHRLPAQKTDPYSFYRNLAGCNPMRIVPVTRI